MLPARHTRALPVSMREPIALAMLLAVPLSVLAANPPTFSDANWASLGLGLDGEVDALVVMGGNLCAGGSFTKAGTNVVNRVAKWDGTA
jgi:hypothetical protein